MKDFNDQNKILITIRHLHFNKKTKNFFRPFDRGADKTSTEQGLDSPLVRAWKEVFYNPSRRTDEDESGAQNFVDIMVKIHNKIQNIKSPTLTGDPAVPC